jgi:16S rRNA (adenine1518-N6/adenine1519-N6)-dimethyltransferase
MSQTKHQIQEFLAQAGSHPRHRFGQNFMIDQNLVRIVADAGEPTSGDLVIEVGPGTGTLTEELLARGTEVLAVEIDRDLAAMLRQWFEAEVRFSLIEADALEGKHGLNADLRLRLESARSAGRMTRLIANLPYSIACPLIIDLLAAGVDLLAFTVQKEVAERLRAAAGSEAYGPLSVMVQLMSRVEVLRTMPPQAFWPAPKVDSALVRLTRQDRIGGDVREVGRFVHQLFAARRKTMRRALTQAGHDAERLLAEHGIDPQSRPERLKPEQFLSVFRSADLGQRNAIGIVPNHPRKEQPRRGEQERDPEVEGH